MTTTERPIREFPPGSGINGRPILDDWKIHLTSYYDKHGAWFTWCGQRVPDDHKCPTAAERAAKQRPVTNCIECQRGR